MTIVAVVRGSTRGLPQDLRTAQEAIYFPEVQEMLRRLSEYQLGIFMPHKHDERSGEFQPLPAELVQVESGLKVSFLAAKKMADPGARFLPVGWLWRAGASATVAACEMDGEEDSGEKELRVKHKM